MFTTLHEKFLFLETKELASQHTTPEIAASNERSINRGVSKRSNEEIEARSINCVTYAAKLRYALLFNGILHRYLILQ